MIKVAMNRSGNDRSATAATSEEKIQWLMGRPELWRDVYLSGSHEAKKKTFQEVGLLMQAEGLFSAKTRGSDIGSARFVKQAALRLLAEGRLH